MIPPRPTRPTSTTGSLRWLIRITHVPILSHRHKQAASPFNDDTGVTRGQPFIPSHDLLQLNDLPLLGRGSEGSKRRREAVGRYELERIIDAGSRNESSGIALIRQTRRHTGFDRFHYAH